MNTQQNNTKPRPLTTLVDELERTLRDSMTQHAALLELLRAGREAICAGDAARASELCRREHERVGMLSRIERQRQALVVELSRHVSPITPMKPESSQEPPRLADVAAMLPEPYRGRLLSLRERLVAQMREVKRETGIARRALTALLRHASGLVSNVATAAGTGGSYSLPHTPRTVPAVRTFRLSA